jgi:hypothetical protein
VGYGKNRAQLMTSVTTTNLKGWFGAENGLSHFVGVYAYSLAGNVAWADTDPFTNGATETMPAGRFFQQQVKPSGDKRVLW